MDSELSLDALYDISKELSNVIEQLKITNTLLMMQLLQNHDSGSINKEKIKKATELINEYHSELNRNH